MLFTIARLFVIAGCLFAVIYGIITFIKGCKSQYFSVAFLGFIALFLSRLFFYILSVSGGDDVGFSVGVFGQISAYMFFSLANCVYIPGCSGAAHSFKLKPFVVAFIPAAIYGFIAVLAGTIGGIFCEVLYIICLAGAVYFSSVRIAERKNNSYCKAVAPFNVCICVLVYINALNDIVVQPQINAGSVLSIIFAFIGGVIISLMLPVLKKNLEPMEAEQW